MQVFPRTTRLTRYLGISIEKIGSLGITTDYSYDTLGRITEILNTSSATGTLSQFTYAYDAASRVTQYTGPEGTISYSYDATGQLTSATGATNETYNYDPAGNRAGSGYQTGPANRLQSDGTYNYTYDAEGNLVEKTEIATGKTWRFTWDQRNRLTHVTVVDSNGIVVREADYTYDVFNRLIGRRLDYDGDGPQAPEEFWTLYDTPETAAEIAAAIYEPGTLLSNPWADVQNGSLTSRYLYTRAVDEVFARLADDQGQLDLSWYIADRLGSIRQQVDTDGTILNEITYYSFGNVVSETNPAAGDRFKFTGREYDDLTSLYYYRARWYDANAGKFISEDPLGFVAGDYNLSRYVENDPINYIDPNGLSGKGKIIGWAVELVGKKYIKIRAFRTIDQATKYFFIKTVSGKSCSLLMRRSSDAKKVIRAVQKNLGKQQAGKILRHRGHVIRNKMGKPIGRGKNHFQLEKIKGSHVFYLGLAAAVLAGSASQTNAGEYSVEVDDIYIDYYPGKSFAHAFTVTYWAGEDSRLSYIDYFNPLEILAIVGDFGRAIDRWRAMELVGHRIRIVHLPSQREIILFLNKSCDVIGMTGVE